MPLPRSDLLRLPLKAAQNKQTAKPPPACPSHVSLWWLTGFVAEQEALHFSLCFQKRHGPHCLTCIGKLWLAACSSKVCDASASNVSTTLLESTFAVAAGPGLLPLPCSENSVEHVPFEEAEMLSELLAEPSASDTAALEGAFTFALGSGLLPRPFSSPSPTTVAAEELDEASVSGSPSLVEHVEAAEGSGRSPDSDAAAELMAASSADSSADAAADWLAELSGSGSETASDEETFSMVVAAAEELALGEELAAPSSLAGIAAAPRNEAGG